MILIECDIGHKTILEGYTYNFIMLHSIYSGAQNQFLKNCVEGVDTSDLSSAQHLDPESEVFIHFKCTWWEDMSGERQDFTEKDSTEKNPM